MPKKLTQPATCLPFEICAQSVTQLIHIWMGYNMSNKIERATEIHRSMTPHQMALRIVELEDIAEIVGQSASERAKRITELQDALELAEEAVLAKQPEAPEGWQLVPVEPTEAMISEVIDAGSFDEDDVTYFWDSMLAAAPKLGGE